MERPRARLTVSPQVQALLEAMSAVGGQDPAALSPEQALVDVRALLAAKRQLDNALLSRVGDVDARRLHDLDGATSTNAWMEQQQATLGKDTVTLARRLSRLPALQTALADGALSVAVAQRLSKALAKLRPVVDRPDGLIDGQDAEQALAGVIGNGVRELFCQALGGLADDDGRLLELIALLAEVQTCGASQIERLEAAFVLLATRIEPWQLPGALQLLTDALLPNELDKRAGKGEDEAGLTLNRKSDGSGWRIDGELDLETGELLHTVLTAEEAVDQDNPVDTEAWRRLRANGWQSPDELPASGAPRSVRRRRHDALRNALRRLLDSAALGSRDKAAPHIAVFTGIGALHGQPGALPAVAASGTTLPLSLVRRWCCDSAATRFVMSLGRRVIEASHTERTLKAHERRAKHAETGGRCQAAGCRCGQGRRLIPHHADPWSSSHTTSLRETVLFCERDHALLHQGRTIRLKDGRLLNEHGWVQP
ncbi:MAG: 13E12 repeat family protein [Frankiaceae bacterium]|nr:13E12 repeat family protein [Frankiaceae bacterium]